MDKFQEMRVFAGVVDAGSFVGAADALGMSKAAVSRHVSDLEQRLTSAAQAAQTHSVNARTAWPLAKSPDAGANGGPVM